MNYTEGVAENRIKSMKYNNLSNKIEKATQPNGLRPPKYHSERRTEF